MTQISIFCSICLQSKAVLATLNPIAWNVSDTFISSVQIQIVGIHFDSFFADAKFYTELNGQVQTLISTPWKTKPIAQYFFQYDDFYWSWNNSIETWIKVLQALMLVVYTSHKQQLANKSLGFSIPWIKIAFYSQKIIVTVL